MRVRFYQTSSGRSPVRDFLDAQPQETKLEIVDALNLLDQGKLLSMPHSRNLSTIKPGLHELRFRDHAGQLRVIYYIRKSDAIYLIHAFRKKTRELPHKELDLILKRVREL